MKALSAFVGIYSSWIDAVATALMSLCGRIASPHTIKFLENESGDFVFQSGEEGSRQNLPTERAQIIDGKLDLGMAPRLAATLPRSHVELTLQSHRFLFRAIELPSRATEFLGGIVRAQIDRFTPWSAGEAMFGWSQPIQNDTGQIEVSLAATSRDLIEPYVNAIAKTGAHSISVFASVPAVVLSEKPIKVWEENVEGPLKLSHIRQVLAGLLAFIAITFGLSIAASALIGRQHEAQRQDIEYRISSLNSAAQAAKKTTTTAIAAVRQDLAKHKNENLSTVIVLEILSRILPDHTYLSEFRMEGNKMRLTGVTKDAPSLVALMEQSHYFSQAKFFAPTTRSSSNDRERFHIEAIIIQPLVSDRS